MRFPPRWPDPASPNERLHRIASGLAFCMALAQVLQEPHLLKGKDKK